MSTVGPFLPGPIPRLSSNRIQIEKVASWSSGHGRHMATKSQCSMSTRSWPDVSSWARGGVPPGPGATCPPGPGTVLPPSPGGGWPRHGMSTRPCQGLSAQAWQGISARSWSVRYMCRLWGSSRACTCLSHASEALVPFKAIWVTSSIQTSLVFSTSCHATFAGTWSAASRTTHAAVQHTKASRTV